MARYFCNKCRGRHRCTCASSAKQTFATETVNKVITIPAVPQSSETVSGRIEIATQAETNTGTDDSRAITPLKLQQKLDSTLEQGAMTSTIPAPTNIIGQTASTAYDSAELQQVMLNQETISDRFDELVSYITELGAKLDQVITK